MNGIFIKKVLIENYKCFQRKSFELSPPDGSTPGSGLNVLIGENGNGKTALLEAINYASQSAYASENRLRVNDFNDYAKPIRVTIDTNDFRCKMSAPHIILGEVSNVMALSLKQKIVIENHLANYYLRLSV